VGRGKARVLVSALLGAIVPSFIVGAMFAPRWLVEDALLGFLLLMLWGMLTLIAYTCPEWDR
jgi:hypothetical protein